MSSLCDFQWHEECVQVKCSPPRCWGMMHSEATGGKGNHFCFPGLPMLQVFRCFLHNFYGSLAICDDYVMIRCTWNWIKSNLDSFQYKTCQRFLSQCASFWEDLRKMWQPVERWDFAEARYWDDNLVWQQTHGGWPDGDCSFLYDLGVMMIFTTCALLHPLQDVSIAPPVPKDFFQRTVDYYCSKTCPYV